MLRQKNRQRRGAPSSSSHKTNNNTQPQTPLTATSPTNMQQTSSHGDTATFLTTMNDPTVIERVRCTIKHAHVFKLPPRQAASIGWRGADWREKIWQGVVKVVDRNDLTAVLLVEKKKGENGSVSSASKSDSIFAVCPIKEGAVERCVDSSRYFVLRIENQNGRHMFIGVAFNERNDAFDFNTALEDARREREFELRTQNQENNDGSGGDTGIFTNEGVTTDYSLKAGEKIRVSIPSSKKKTMDQELEGGTQAFANFKIDSPESVETSGENERKPRAKSKQSTSFFSGLVGGSNKSGFALKPSTKDTPTRSN